MIRSILVTGGSGSFGRAFVRELLLAPEKPDRIVVFSRGEHTQEQMARDLAPLDPKERLRFFIGDVRDRDRLELAMHGVEAVVHAAALKVVAKCEVDPSEAIKTNVVGADNVVHASIRAGVKKVIAISSDKACAPVNLYGSTKMCAEKLFAAADVYTGGEGTRFAVVRYGNVAKSRGSVIPLWRSLIMAGQKKVTVTDPDATRFWLEMDEATATVLWTFDRMLGGEIVIPAGMPAFRVGDLAEAMGVEAEVIGLRDGEKLHEEIINQYEARNFFQIDRYWVSGMMPKGTAPILSGALTSQHVMGIEELKRRLADLDVIKAREAA